MAQPSSSNLPRLFPVYIMTTDTRSIDEPRPAPGLRIGGKQVVLSGAGEAAPPPHRASVRLGWIRFHPENGVTLSQDGWHPNNDKDLGSMPTDPNFRLRDCREWRIMMQRPRPDWYQASGCMGVLDMLVAYLAYAVFARISQAAVIQLRMADGSCYELVGAENPLMKRLSGGFINPPSIGFEPDKTRSIALQLNGCLRLAGYSGPNPDLADDLRWKKPTGAMFIMYVVWLLLLIPAVILVVWLYYLVFD